MSHLSHLSHVSGDESGMDGFVTVRELYAQCVGELRASGDESAEFDAGCIVQDLIGIKNIYSDKRVDKSRADAVRGAVEKVSCGYPLQYVLGSWEFYGMTFKVGEGVLIPRQDTETLVDVLLERLSGASAASAATSASAAAGAAAVKDKRIRLRGVELCAGSGCVGIALEKKLPCEAEITLVENSPDAYRYLSENVSLLESKARIMLADVLEQETAERFSQLDFIVCNPPYLSAADMADLQKQVSFEPREALFGGEDGLDYYSAITRIWKSSLRDGGVLCYEIGMGREMEVSRIMIQLGFEDVRFVRDATGTFRVVYGCNRV